MLQDQAQGFVYACFTGLALGLFYDFFRVLRIFLHCERRPVFFQDLLCFAVTAVVTFLLALWVNYGEVRFYLLAGEGIGICVYFLTFGEITGRLSQLIFRVISACWRFLKRRFFCPIKKAFFRFFKWISLKLCRREKTLKNQGEIEKTP